MRPVPFPSDLYLPKDCGLEKQIVSGPSGDLNDQYISPVDTLVSIGSIHPDLPPTPQYLIKIKLEDDDIGSLLKHGHFYLRFNGGVFPFALYIEEDIHWPTQEGNINESPS